MIHGKVFAKYRFIFRIQWYYFALCVCHLKLTMHHRIKLCSFYCIFCTKLTHLIYMMNRILLYLSASHFRIASHHIKRICVHFVDSFHFEASIYQTTSLHTKHCKLPERSRPLEEGWPSKLQSSAPIGTM